MNYVALLGTKGGPAIRTGSPGPTSSVVCLGGHWAVVDCGLGVTRGLVEQGLALKDLSLIFVTHLHSDHYLELGPLLHTAWTAGLATPVQVWGPSGLRAAWEGFLASMQADIDLRIEDEGRPDLRDLVRFGTIAADEEIVEGGLRVSALAAIHPPLSEAWALSFRPAAGAVAAGRSGQMSGGGDGGGDGGGSGPHVVFSGDTACNPALVAFAAGCDLLVHEAMLAEGLEALVARVGNGDDRLMRHLLRSHTLASDAARTATEAGARALALHHLIPSDDPGFGPADWHRAVAPHWSGPLHLGRDGLRIEL